jgi:enoyl-CoA hydratase/carnithine racemase
MDAKGTKDTKVRAVFEINYSAVDGVALIELNDLPANTYSYEMMQEIDAAILAARMDAGVHVIVITGRVRSSFVRVRTSGC